MSIIVAYSVLVVLVGLWFVEVAADGVDDESDEENGNDYHEDYHDYFCGFWVRKRYMPWVSIIEIL